MSSSFFSLILYFLNNRHVYRSEEMNTKRSFKHRLAPVSLLMPVILMVLAFWLLLYPKLSNFIVGMLLVFVIVLMLERLLHTEYVLEDHRLIIHRGRFLKTIVINLDEIVEVKPVRRKLIPLRYILIEYGQGKTVGVQPVNENGFLKEMKIRVRNKELKMK